IFSSSLSIRYPALSSNLPLLYILSFKTHTSQDIQTEKTLPARGSIGVTQLVCQAENTTRCCGYEPSWD
ncbi:MAG: hypothetical protein U9N37_07050, partial [Thermodesulfobacteriota bacterium]|nr:hypothetical protein [Thermodesulfobacteriota bacterium]